MCHGTLTFFTIKEQDIDVFSVFNYGIGTFFGKIIFREIARHPRTFSHS